MAGLAPHAANFFKFLFVLVLYSMAMTLFVSHSKLKCEPFTELGPKIEFFAWYIIREWGHRYLTLSFVCAIPDDVRRFLCAPRLYTACSAVATVVVPAEI
jgi:hypothetical protein